MTQTTHPAPPTTADRSPRTWPVALLAPAAVAAAGWLVASPLLGIDLQTGSSAHPTAITFPAAVVVSVLAAAAGLALRRLLRTRSNPNRTWTAVAAVVLAVSLLGPLGATSTAAVVALAALHLTVGLTIIYAVRRTPSHAPAVLG